MARRTGGPGGEIPWEDIARKMGDIWRKIGGKKEGGPPRRLGGIVVGIVVAIIVVIWLLTGIYTVGPGEVGVVRQFGREVGQTSPGLRYHLPGPIQRVDKVNRAEIKTVNIGFREVSPDTYQDVLSEALMLTGDENIVDIHLTVQYRVQDASQYLFNVRDPDLILKTASEVALRGIVGQNTIDYVLVEARADVEEGVREFLQMLMDDYQVGLLIVGVKLQEVDAPTQVREAFQDVVRAKEDLKKVVDQANAYREDLLPRARGEAEQMVRGADAYKQQRVIRASGDVARFIKVLREHEVPAALQALAEFGVAQAAEALAEPAVTEEAKGVTREALYDILADLGVLEEGEQAKELTGQRLLDVLAQVGVLQEYEQAYKEAMALTRQRLYLETIEAILPGIEKIIIDSEIGGNLLPFLPLRGTTGLGQPE